MKGLAGAIIFLIIIGAGIFLLLPYISKIRQPTIPTPEIEYKNDIISIEDLYISNSKPYAGSPVIIEFLVQNNGDEKVDWVKVNFYDIPEAEDGFKVKKLDCQDTQPQDNKCIFEGENAIDSLDLRKVSLTLEAPPEEVIVSPLEFIIRYSIEYNYSGYRKATIPIIDAETRLKPLGKFTESKSSYGPIQLDFELVPRGETKIETQVVKEYWGVPNQPLEIKFSFNDVVKKAKSINITKGNVKLNISNLTETEMYPCDFNRTGDTLVSTRDVLVSKEKLLCYFLNSSVILQPEISTMVSAEFIYNYEFKDSQKITVQPIPE